MSSDSGRDRRKFTRYAVSIPVSILVSGQTEPIKGRMINVSAGGAFIECDHRFDSGVHVLIEIPFANVSLLRGEVSSFTTGHPGKKAGMASTVVRWLENSQPAGFGVQFGSLPDDTKAFLKDVIEYFEKQEA